ncbi:hypothetical protein E2C01_088774 [Portunus trituberculatus]|uniref:Uncharacterized protein n=1 Tax=Portunus trituberculatus TaxID=210409 RepID=A0A5B7JKS6_PORTR|nr:hypothetical protein [Portunus trituberculatus]
MGGRRGVLPAGLMVTWHRSLEGCGGHVQTAGGTTGRGAAKGLDKQEGRVENESFSLYEMRAREDSKRLRCEKFLKAKKDLPGKTNSLRPPKILHPEGTAVPYCPRLCPENQSTHLAIWEAAVQVTEDTRDFHGNQPTPRPPPPSNTAATTIKHCSHHHQTLSPTPSNTAATTTTTTKHCNTATTTTIKHTHHQH